MMFLMVLAGLVALCSGNAIPTVPGDNSHYVPGKSRYIWGPDDNGNPVLVDLHKPADEAFLKSRDGANNQYWLYTRQNPASPHILIDNDISTVASSNFQVNSGIVVIVHGWNNNGNSLINPTLTAAFLELENVNVIVVDWRAMANTEFNTAAAGVYDVGQYLGRFLLWLTRVTWSSFDNVHLIGFSMGAHVVASASRVPGVHAKRITGLDPAGPTWENNPNALNSNDGMYVEAIHTDGGGFGIFNTSGHVDFFPNGGRNPQPGCSVSSCSHVRVWDYYAATLRFGHLFGYRCTDINEAANVSCSGELYPMGNADWNKRGRGIYGLRTGALWPY